MKFANVIRPNINCVNILESYKTTVNCSCTQCHIGKHAMNYFIQWIICLVKLDCSQTFLIRNNMLCHHVVNTGSTTYNYSWRASKYNTTCFGWRWGDPCNTYNWPFYIFSKFSKFSKVRNLINKTAGKWTYMSLE